jgi:hypothetical protein
MGQRLDLRAYRLGNRFNIIGSTALESVKNKHIFRMHVFLFPPSFKIRALPFRTYLFKSLIVLRVVNIDLSPFQDEINFLSTS